MMLTHVIPILLLIGSLAAGVTCFTWSGGPEANSTVRPCPGDNVTLDWTFSLSDKDRLLSVQWFLAQDNKTQKAVGFVSPPGSFFKVPDIKTRVEFLPPAGLRLYNVSTRDLGTYTVHVTLYRNDRHDVIQRSVTLALPHKPYLLEGRLVASLEPRTVTVNGTSHARLTCGTILNHQEANFSVVWKTPGGQTVPSSGHSDGVFYLVLANPVEGGAYHCYLHGVTSLTCQHSGTQSSAGRVEVDRLQTRLMVLEASAGRYDRQLLHANYESTDLAALEREANDSLEVRAALDGLQAKTQSLDTVDTELRNLTAEQTQQLNTLGEQLDTVRTELKNLTAEQTQQLNTLDEQLDTVNTELRNLTAEHAQQLNTLGTELSNMKAEHTRQVKTVEKWMDTVDTELRNMNAEHTQQLNTLSTELRDMKAEHTQQLNTLSTELRDMKAEHTQQLNTLSTELRNVKAEHTRQLNTLSTELRDVKAEHTRQMNTVYESLNALSTEVTNLTTTTAEQKQLNRLDGKLTLAGQERREDKAALERLTSLVEQLNNTVSHQELVIANLTLQLGIEHEDGKVQHPSSCLDIKWYNDQDGVHTLSVSGHKMTVFCDQTTAGGGWTVIQRRVDGRVDFYRGWTEYREGFGTVDHEYWLGLENIHLLTKNRSHELRVDLWDFEGNTAFAQYRRFSLDGESNNYRLTVGNFDRSSTARDGLAFHNNMAFSTHDRDNDKYSGNCAQDWHGAWWYNICHHSNLNGRYKTSAQERADGVTWYHWKTRHISLKKVEMKIRPV